MAPSITLPSDPVVEEGSEYDLNGSFTDPGVDLWAATASINGGPSVALAIGPDKTFTVPLDVSQDGTFAVQVCIDDETAVSCESTTVEVENVAPSFSLGPDRVVDEGETVTITEMFTDPGADSWTATFALDGGPHTPLVLDGMTFEIRQSYLDDAVSVIEVCVADDHTTTCDDVRVEVRNVAPEVTIEAVPSTFVTLVSDEVVAAFADAGALDTHSARVEWGDGSIEELGPVVGGVSTSHAYEDAGPVAVRLCVTDDDGGEGCASATVEVLSPGLALDAALDELVGAGVSDPAVQDAIEELAGSASPARSGALTRLAEGDFVAAVSKIGHAIDDLERADSGHDETMRLLAQVAEGIARDLQSEVLALGLTSRGDLTQVDRIADAITAGSTAVGQGHFAEAVDHFLGAVRRATNLLDS